MKQSINNEKGVILGTVVVLGLILGILAVTSYLFMGQRAMRGYNVIKKKQALYSGRAGIEYALFRLRNSKESAPGFLSDFSVSGNTYTKIIDVTDPLGSGPTPSTLKRNTVNVLIEREGAGTEMTDDGIRPKYKIVANVEY